MKVRTQKRWLYTAGTLFLVAGVAAITLALLYPPTPPKLDQSADIDEAPRAEHLRTVEQFGDLLNKRLQGPLVDPPPPIKKVATATPNKPELKLPSSIDLQGILYSKESAVAVIKASSGIVRCGLGDSVEGAKITKILADEVVFEFQGKEFRRPVKN